MDLEIFVHILAILAYSLGIAYYLPKVLQKNKLFIKFKYKLLDFMYLVGIAVYIVLIIYYFQGNSFEISIYKVPTDSLYIFLLLFVTVPYYYFFNYKYRQIGKTPTEKIEIEEPNIEKTEIKEYWRFILQKHKCIPDEKTAITSICEHYNIPENRAKKRFNSACELFLGEK